MLLLDTYCAGLPCLQEQVQEVKQEVQQIKVFNLQVEQERRAEEKRSARRMARVTSCCFSCNLLDQLEH